MKKATIFVYVAEIRAKSDGAVSCCMLFPISIFFKTHREKHFSLPLPTAMGLATNY